MRPLPLGVRDLPSRSADSGQGQPANAAGTRHGWAHTAGLVPPRNLIPACEAAGLVPAPTIRDLRHALASWLLAGGADLQVVKERLGHATIATTERYLHTLPGADETALDARHAIRTRNSARRA